MERPPGKELTISGRRVAFDVSGSEGVPCVLLHAFPFDRRFWGDITGRLHARTRVITPDLRGFGGSDLGGAYSIADLADDVAALLDGLGIERAVVGGVSMGGYVSLAFAARHRHRLLGLLLADTKAGADTPEGRRARDSACELVRGSGVDAYLDGQIPRLLGPDAPESLRARVRSLGQQTPGAVVAGLEAMRDRPDRREELAEIDCPTLVMVGTEDQLTPPADAAIMATAIRRAVLLEVPGAGHLSNLEAPTPFAQAVAGFVGRTATL